MKKIISRYLLALSLTSLATPAFATDLVDIFQQAVDSDPVYQAAKSTRLSVHEQLPQSVAALLPNLSATASAATNNTNILTAAPATGLQTGSATYSSNGYAINLTQPLISFSDWMQVSKANATVKQADANFGAATQDLIIRVATAYFNVLQAQESLSYVQAQKAVTVRQLDQAKHRFNAGENAMTSVYDAQAAYDKAVAQEITAQNILRNNQEALRQLTGQTYSSLDSFKTAIPLLTPKPANIEQWITASTRQNLPLLAQGFAVQAARENIKVNFGGHLPTVDAVGSYGRTNGQVEGVNQTQSSAGIQVTIPLFAGGMVNSQVRQAQYDYQTATSNRENTYRSVIITTRQKYNDVLAGISKIKADRQTILSAQASLDSTEEGYKVGSSTMVDVLIAVQNLYNAKQALTLDEYNYLLSTLQLKQAAGTLSPNDLAEINKWLHRPKRA